MVPLERFFLKNRQEDERLKLGSISSELNQINLTLKKSVSKEVSVDKNSAESIFG